MVIQVDNNVIKLYGEIYPFDGTYIASRIEEAAKDQKEITVRLHTPGGDVFSGNLIYNSLLKSKAKVRIEIDGLAGSMGTIIMLAADTLAIAENAFIMIHAPNGGMRGTAKEIQKGIKVLQALEKQFVKNYTERTGKTEDEVKAWMEGDNWFDAEEAKAEGIVDEVIPAKESVNNLDAILAASNNYTSLAACFEPYNKPAEGSTFPSAITSEEQGEKPPQKPKDKSKSNREMKLNAKSITALGLGEAPSDEAVNAKIAAITQRNADLEAEATARNAQAIEDLLDKHKTKYDAKLRPTYKAMAESNLENAKAILESLPTPQGLPNPTEENKPSAGIPAERKDWTAKQWKQNDMKGLIALKTENPEAYQALFK